MAFWFFNREKTLRDHINSGQDVNEKWSNLKYGNLGFFADGFTALHLVGGTSDGDYEFMLDSGANINIVDDSGETPLHAVCFLGNFEKIKMLLKRCPSTDIKDYINKKTKFNSTALDYACYTGNIDAVKYLISLGASVSEKNAGGDTCLHRAFHLDVTIDDRLEIVKTLLKACPNILNEKNNKNLTALYYAKKNVSDGLNKQKTITAYIFRMYQIYGKFLKYKRSYLEPLRLQLEIKFNEVYYAPTGKGALELFEKYKN